MTVSEKTSLESNGIVHQYELFPGTNHGWGIGIGMAAEGWLERAVNMWIKMK